MAPDQSPGQKPQRAADLLPGVTLPKGGGAIRGIGEKFSVNAATGTGAMAVPVQLSPGRSGFTPQLRLAYDSGAGNGPFGFGWNLDVPAITRKTDKGLPRYQDDDESDVFILSGAEDLVPILDAAGARKQLPRTVFGVAYQLRFYRPRVEGLFARIERWTEVDTGISHWRSISRDNVTTLYGLDAASRIADPAHSRRTFSWRICRSFDDKGNVAVYRYIAEDGAGVDPAQAHEANRTTPARSSQIYLQTIQYGNLEPYIPVWSAAAETPVPGSFMFQVVLDYGDHAPVAPTPQRDRSWPVRPDPFSTYRAGFEIRTYRRVQRLLFFNNFPSQPEVGADGLVRSLDLTYSDQQSPADPRAPIYTFVASMTQTGYRRNGSLISRSLPPLEFAYGQPQIQQDVLRVDRDSLGNLPEGLDGTRFRFVDLDGEGLSGILAEARNAWYYKPNLGADNLIAQPDGSLAARARFGPPETVAALPSRAELSGQQLLALAGDGRLDVVDFAGPDVGFFKRTIDAGFEPLRRFLSLPQVDWSDPNTKLVDLTGDGLADILLTEDGLFTFHPSLGEAGFDAARTVHTPWDEDKGPKVVLADGSETIFLADMSGDGLTDIVRVRNGEACYWPNVGYGRFGPKVTMDRAPRFDNQEHFDPRRIRLADIDGTGAADLIYVGEDGIRAWFNQSGNAWSAPSSIGVFPTADQLGSVQAIDLLGTGTSCLVWSSPLPGESANPLLYVDLMGGRKPHLLVQVRNNLGAETRLTYAPSTRFYLADKAAGKPWITRLPFPVQVVERVESIDWIGRNRLITRYAYHHGHFDGYEREFRGFGMVEQHDTEEFRTDTAFADGDFVNWDQQSWSPPMRSCTWFHTGAFEDALAVSAQYATEYWTEPALRGSLRAADAAAMRLSDTVLPANLAPFESREAYRALKGQALRIETYADDGAENAGNPYKVTEQNFTILCLQNMGANPHAVFFVHPREAVTFHYERGNDDPRVGHEITLETDLYGNVKRSVSVGYPRRAGYAVPEPTLSATAQAMLAYDQTRPHARASEHRYTNAIDDLATWPDAYRAPLPCATDAAEITGIKPSTKGAGITNLFTFVGWDNGDPHNPGIWQTAWTGNRDIAYEAIPASDVEGTGVLPGATTRRFVARRRTLYRGDDLTALLPAGQLQPRALPGESYTAALTQGQLDAIYGTLVTPAILREGGYVQLAGESGWWMPSGRLFHSPGDNDAPAHELAFALAHFFLPRRALDPFGAVSRIDYDGFDLLPATATDPVGNATSAVSDYRVLMPATVTDPNGNRAAIACDAFGLVVATALMGKVSETLGDQLAGFVADLDDATIAAHFANPLAGPDAILGSATTRMVYDLGAYLRTRDAAQPSPPAVYTLTRETHVSDLVAGQTTRFQYRLAYSDGFGREIQRKALAAPGPVTPGGPPVSPRWVGSGWTIFNNKGKPVRRYEPFFSTTGTFEFATQSGVSTVLFYDPPARVVATLHPDNSWEKVVFDPWRQEAFDRNDTILIADPRTDADVGGHFQRLLGSAPNAFTSWHDLRIRGAYGVTGDDHSAQQDAAQKAQAHAATPAVTHFDALGRACLAVADNGGINRYAGRTALDTQGKPLALFDALGRRAEEYCLRVAPPGGGYIAGTDMAGNPLYHINQDGGARRGLVNVAGKPIRNWDARDHAFRLQYDAAQRSTHRYVSTGGAAEILIDRSIYGEGQPSLNLCDKLFRRYDTAGLVANNSYDYKGNLLSGTRQLAVDYHQTIDWLALAALTSPAALDAAAQSLLSSVDRFDTSNAYDALNRPIQVVTPHSVTTKPNVQRPGYDEAGLLRQVEVWLQLAAAPSGLLDPATADRHIVTGIDYDARGQRLAIAFGNATRTTYDYDPQTFRLAHLTTTRPSSFAPDQRIVQALAYYYDPVGNVTRIRDAADTQNVIYFQNQRVEPSSDYTYDPIYRLVAASGREHLGQNGGVLAAPQQVADDDSSRIRQLQPSDGTAMGTYSETYAYDPAGNILTMAHQVSSGNWTRRYAYSELSHILAGETGNRLSATSVPGDPVGGPFSATYAYDAHGNMTRMPHLPALTFDESDRLRSTTRQVVASGTPEATFYVYDGGGQRVRKATDRQTQAGQGTSRKSERIYLGAVEIYRELASDDALVTLRRETLRVTAGDQTIALVETRTLGTDPAAAQVVRYQHANHLGSAMLQLGDQSAIISYEEYFPFGSTSYQAVASQTDLPKRYRYTGKERDAENDLYYQGTRYYVPWLGRWTSCDPIGIRGGINLYAYVRGNPVRFADPTGNEPEPATINSPPPASAPAKPAGDAPPPQYHWGGRLQDSPPPDPRQATDPNQRLLNIFFPPIIIRPSGTPTADPAQEPPAPPQPAPSSPPPGNFNNAPIYANAANSVTTPGKGVVGKEAYGAIVRDPSSDAWVFQPHVAEFHGITSNIAVGGDVQATMGQVDSRGASFGATIRIGSSEDVSGYRPRFGLVGTARLNLTVGGNSPSGSFTGIYTQPLGETFQLDVNAYYNPATDKGVANAAVGGVGQISAKNLTILGIPGVTLGLEGGALRNQHTPDDKVHAFGGIGVSVDTTPKPFGDHEPEKKSQWSFYVEGITGAHPGAFFTLGYGAAGRGDVF